MMGASMTIAFLIIRVPYGLLSGLAIGLLGMVPFGAPLGIVLVSVIAAFKSVWVGLRVLIVATVIDQIIENVIAPTLVGCMSGEGGFLADASVGDRLCIVGLTGDASKGRLLGMEIAPGATLEVMSATTPGSVVIALNHQRLGLGIEMARQSRMVPAERAIRRPRSEMAASAVQLRDLTVGSKAQVVGYEKSGRAYRRKLLAMGLTRGTEFVVTRRAPLGDPIELKVRGFSLSLRKHEADALQVKLTSQSTKESTYAF